MKEIITDELLEFYGEKYLAIKRANIGFIYTFEQYLETVLRFRSFILKRGVSIGKEKEEKEEKVDWSHVKY